MDILRLLDYDLWATRQVLEATKALSAEQFVQELAGELGSVRQQAVHLVSVPDRYRARIMREPEPDVSPASFASQDELIRYSEEVAARMRAMAATLTYDRLPEVIHHRTRRGMFVLTIDQTLHHVINHGTYHRGQIACLLKLHGIEPVDTDLILWPEVMERTQQSGRG